MTFIQRKLLFILLISATLLMTSCGDDDSPEATTFGVAFETTSAGIADDEDHVTVNVTFSSVTTVSNQITVRLQEKGITYGADYTTTPAAVNGILLLDVPSGAVETSFAVNRIGDAISEGNTVTFMLEEVSGEENIRITGNTEITVSFSSVASGGAAMTAENGGPTQPNMVFVDLSLNQQVTAARTSWDLGVYNGEENKVIVNYATYGMAYPLAVTDMNAVSAADTSGLSGVLQIGTAGADIYIDHPDGDLTKLAIADISADDSENKVYIINRGAGPGTGEVSPGNADVSSTERGWKKVRILMRGNDYLIQHADINATTFSETTLSKNEAFNFSYFSFDGNNPIVVEPQSDKYDLIFTVSSNIINFGFGDGAYGFSDYVKTNRSGGVKVAEVRLETDSEGTVIPGQTTYDEFDISDVCSLSLIIAANTIGSDWRSVFTRTTNADRFYVVEDPEGNLYKLQFTGLLNDRGERGFTSFEYELL
ncbi:MAG: HmuY family protein [Cyclobacteriaceae bacterium]